MSFWCSAQSGVWDWSWQPYLGVWMIVGALSWWYLRGISLPGVTATAGRTARFFAGVFLFWVSADWPLGPLGAGYLLSVHTLQYLVFSFAVPPLILSGLPPELIRRLLDGRVRRQLAWFFTRPLIAFAVFNVVLLASHLPEVVDEVAGTQIGSFAVNMSWLFGGFLFWWQVLGPLPEFEPMKYPGRILFLIFNVFIPTVPAAFLTFARYPIYRQYELAAPVLDLSATDDQRIAALMMKILGGLIIFATASVLFFQWYRLESDDDELDGSSGFDPGGDHGPDDGPSEPVAPPAEGGLREEEREPALV